MKKIMMGFDCPEHGFEIVEITNIDKLNIEVFPRGKLTPFCPLASDKRNRKNWYWLERMSLVDIKRIKFKPL